jgi:hypothetical protein
MVSHFTSDREQISPLDPSKELPLCGVLVSGRRVISEMYHDSESKNQNRTQSLCATSFRAIQCVGGKNSASVLLHVTLGSESLQLPLRNTASGHGRVKKIAGETQKFRESENQLFGDGDGRL